MSMYLERINHVIPISKRIFNCTIRAATNFIYVRFVRYRRDFMQLRKRLRIAARPSTTSHVDDTEKTKNDIVVLSALGTARDRGHNGPETMSNRSHNIRRVDKSPIFRTRFASLDAYFAQRLTKRSQIETKFLRQECTFAVVFHKLCAEFGREDQSDEQYQKGKNVRH